MVNEQNTGVYFVEGYVARKDLVGIVTYLEELEGTDAEHTRFYMLGDHWSHLEIDHEIVSMVKHLIKPDTPSWQLLSKRGVVVGLTAAGVVQEEIKDAGTGPQSYGYLSQIREIDGTLYTCGMCRQVYKRSGRGWVHMDDGILAPRESVDFCLESIDGTDEANLYAVGWKGEIFHFDGKKWDKISSPTNLDLERVRCAGPDLVYICGQNGVLLRGSGSTWEAFQDDDFDEDLWGLEIFNDMPYVAWRGGLLRFDGAGLIPVETGLEPPIDGGRLHAADGLLWSFGEEHLACFDGKKWERVICPDNE
ncbi:MAG: hypothetical protein V3T84_06300 [Phycisphaerales bacterium]